MELPSTVAAPTPKAKAKPKKLRAGGIAKPKTPTPKAKAKPKPPTPKPKPIKKGPWDGRGLKPFDGAVEPWMPARVAEALFGMGCYEVSLGDTIGHATPESTDAMLDAMMEVEAPEKFAGHFHDTKGHALENIGVSLERGLRVFDSCVGGLGGCPYAPGAQANVATEAVIPFVESKGFETGLNLEKVSEAASFAKSLVGFTNATD